MFSVSSRLATLTARAVLSIYLVVPLLNWDDGFEFLIEGVICSAYKNNTAVRKTKIPGCIVCIAYRHT